MQRRAAERTLLVSLEIDGKQNTADLTAFFNAHVHITLFYHTPEQRKKKFWLGGGLNKLLVRSDILGHFSDDIDQTKAGLRELYIC